jgi:hypothetical protein
MDFLVKEEIEDFGLYLVTEGQVRAASEVLESNSILF